MRRIAPLALALAFGSGPACASELVTHAGTVGIARVADGLAEPWSLAFLPGGDALVTERGGRLTRLGANGGVHPVSGLPEVHAKGQGGLFDILVPRDFAEAGEVLISFAKPQPGGAGTAVAAARMVEDALVDLRVIWEMSYSPILGQISG